MLGGICTQKAQDVYKRVSRGNILGLSELLTQRVRSERMSRVDPLLKLNLENGMELSR